jgi:hypothetical protein
MADKEDKTESKAEGSPTVGRIDGDDIKLPGNAGGSLPAALVHREPYSGLTKADK